MPLSRWGHRLVARENACGLGSADALFLFGGCNLKSYCEGSSIFEFVFSDQAAALAAEENDRAINLALARQQRETSPRLVRNETIMSDKKRT